MFLVDMICTQTPAHWHLKIPIKWYVLIYFVSLEGKNRSSICPEKATENSIQMENAPGVSTDTLVNVLADASVGSDSLPLQQKVQD